MGLIIQRADFTGVYDLAKSANDKINAYIEQYEYDILVDLLGQELYDLFEASVLNPPVDTIYQTLIDPLIPYKGCNLKSKGIKDMLLCMVRFYYRRDNVNKESANGTVNNISEVSNGANLSSLHLQYNNGVQSYKAIQAYIRLNIVDYPEFAGVCKSYSSMF